MLEVLRDGQPFQQHSPFSRNQVFADGEGRFEVLVPAGVELTLRLFPTTSPDGRILTGELGRVVAGAAPLELRQRVVANDQSVNVIVTGPDGTPAPGIQVYARLRGQDVPGANVLTDAAGRAELKRLPAVPLLVQATPTAGGSGRDRWAKWSSGLVTPAGQDLQARLLVGRVLEGRALDPEDQPVAGALVSLMNRSGIVDGVRSDAEGRFRIVVSPEAEGPFSLSASTNTLMATLENVVPDAKPVVLSMSR